MSITKNLSNFEKKVLDCRNNLKCDIIKNDSKEYALILFENLLDVALEKTEDVKIVSGSLDKTFYNKLVQKINLLLDKVQVTVFVLEDVDLSGNHFASAVTERGDLRVNKTGKKINIPHFILVGDRRFRIETDHNQAQADASFDDEALGKVLLNFYNEAGKAIPASVLV